RDDLNLMEGPSTRHGAPTWTLYDPLANRYFRLGWMEFEMLARWGAGDARAVSEALAGETPILVGAEDVTGFARFLEANGLCRAEGEAAAKRLLDQTRAGRKGWFLWLLKNYLFLRVRLVRPDRFLAVTLPLVSWMFSRAFLGVVLAVAALGLWLVGREWDAFVSGLLGFVNPEGALLAGAVLAGVKVLHELGHGYAARRYGCRVPGMGIAFIVLLPVLWTDTTGAWRLTSRRQRLAIDGAGVLVELTLAAFASVAWAVLPEGPGRDMAHLVAGTTWITTLLVNLNPLMRFDGYYLFADFLDEPNLQDRSFALGRWRLRELLFGFGEPQPEALPKPRRRLLVAYAWATWLYRFFLFLGIALVVYHLFFKLLGVFLFAVEIWWFIMRPIVSELRAWGQHGRRMRPNRHTAVSLLLLGMVSAAFLVPWRTHVAAPALLQGAGEAMLYAPVPGRLDRAPEEGTRIEAGGTVAELGSPDLALRITAGERRVEHLTARVAEASVDAEAARRTLVAWEELAAAGAELEALRANRAKLVVKAPLAGTVIDVPGHLAHGDWIAAGEPLGMVVADGVSVWAYVAEAELGRIGLGAQAWFHPEHGLGPPVRLRLVSLAPAAARSLDDVELASVHGGGIPAGPGEDGRVVPHASVYAATLVPDGPADTPAQVVRGSVLIDAASYSPAEAIWNRIVGLVIRESGF
ncbi:MAG TPA: HlyD family efflux transporter periplasmic adaptor subunit, partial [Arenibaculum sp.]|nr:HlyD family efflux transporter periplasmic adaptor subunit [Arenibaculum sp.]